MKVWTFRLKDFRDLDINGGRISVRELRKISVLLNKETGERYDNGDLVKIIETGTYKREYVGRIRHIDTLELILDMSKEYEGRERKIKYDDIEKIEKPN